MVHIIDEGVLDTRKEKFQGFQRWIDTLAIRAMSKALDLRHKLPSVELVRTSEGIYQIMSGWPSRVSHEGRYGGTHRIMTYITHREGEILLPYTLWDEHRDPNLEGGKWQWRDFSDIRQYRKSPMGLLTTQFIGSLAHLPRKERETIILEESIGEWELKTDCKRSFSCSFEDLCQRVRERKGY